MDGATIIALAAALAAALLLAYALAAPARATKHARRRAGVPVPPVRTHGGLLVLDIEVERADDPAVQRVAEELGRRALDADPDVAEAIVVDRGGRQIVRIPRRPPWKRPTTIPEQLHEPVLRRPHGPDPSGGQWADHIPPATTLDAERGQPRTRVFADRFELPESVEARCTDRDNPAAVVEAILLAGGHHAQRHGELVTTPDVAIAVATIEDDADRALSRAYLRIQATGAPRGIVLRIGYADPVMVRCRDLASPGVHHGDVRAIQRMADAVAIGADPLAFAVEPSLQA